MIEESKIELEHIYNIDESSFTIGDIEASQYIINADINNFC